MVLLRDHPGAMIWINYRHCPRTGPYRLADGQPARPRLAGTDLPAGTAVSVRECKRKGTLRTPL